mmetsp:Transcript_115404/g.320873  ORF Transcript_115404/g.320873 Transcript_115404/m.320873 type:complete len:213 (-) Transcript_115404:87-725(-)
MLVQSAHGRVAYRTMRDIGHSAQAATAAASPRTPMSRCQRRQRRGRANPRAARWQRLCRSIARMRLGGCARQGRTASEPTTWAQSRTCNSTCTCTCPCTSARTRTCTCASDRDRAHGGPRRPRPCMQVRRRADTRTHTQTWLGATVEPMTRAACGSRGGRARAWPSVTGRRRPCLVVHQHAAVAQGCARRGVSRQDAAHTEGAPLERHRLDE